MRLITEEGHPAFQIPMHPQGPTTGTQKQRLKDTHGTNPMAITLICNTQETSGCMVCRGLPLLQPVPPADITNHIQQQPQNLSYPSWYP